MAAIIETSIAIEEMLFKQAETLAQQLDMSTSDLFVTAIGQFIRDYPRLAPPGDAQAEALSGGRKVIHQGDVYWLRSENSSGLDADIPHPQVVIQENVFNHSRIPSVVVCALTSNIKRVNLPGNVLLEAGEANLPKQSVVEVSKVMAVDKAQLGEYIGSLSEQRIHQILAGMRFLQASFFER
jgi:mRNA interferase MazF